jgi:hypothetical protein
MCLFKALSLALFICALCLNIVCSLPRNPYDPEDPSYQKPSLIFEGFPTVAVDSDNVAFIVKGKTPKNIFRWRMENPCSTDTALSNWSNWIVQPQFYSRSDCLFERERRNCRYSRVLFYAIEAYWQCPKPVFRRNGFLR